MRLTVIAFAAGVWLLQFQAILPGVVVLGVLDWLQQSWSRRREQAPGGDPRCCRVPKFRSGAA
jgi:hypothetical protein